MSVVIKNFGNDKEVMNVKALAEALKGYSGMHVSLATKKKLVFVSVDKDGKAFDTYNDEAVSLEQFFEA